MTVQCISPENKVSLVQLYSNNWPIKDLSYYFQVSPRTVRRVLAEANMIMPSERIDAEIAKIKRIMKKYGITVDTLDATLSILKGTKHAN
jgi:transcriptional antiterminator